MKFTELGSLLVIGVCATGCIALFATTPQSPDLELINLLDATVHHRFEDPEPANLGMSRVARPPSFGGHFYPELTSPRDFQPEREVEKAVIAALEERKMQVGLYLIGVVIEDSEAAARNFRALKGPAVMTKGTPRPAWYPNMIRKPDADPNPRALPDWNAIYPIAQYAMKSFLEGSAVFETEFDGWNIAARPVIASQQRCVTCHNNSVRSPMHVAKLGATIGGVLYAYKR